MDKQVFLKNITDVARLEQQVETIGAVQVKRILMLLVLLTEEVNIAYVQSKYWQQPVPPECLFFFRDTTSREQRIWFGPFHGQVLCAEH